MRTAVESLDRIKQKNKPNNKPNWKRQLSNMPKKVAMHCKRN
ncbi:hypothetical protein PCI56_10440 [Plesiomonas shigelloides subsp. oncorhynchi]|nr:hypothetical protein [Plesiomonas shigelloides]